MSGKRSLGRAKAILSLIAVFLLAANVSQAKYSGGTGEPNDPYRIATPDDLNDIGNHVEDFNKCFILMADINLANYTGRQFNTIGDRDNPFRGIFDGNGHTIANFTYDSTELDENIGIFVQVSDANAQIRDLKLTDPNVDGGTGSVVGALVAELESGEVVRCSVEGGSVSGYVLVGALVGGCGPDSSEWAGGRIIDCYADTAVEATLFGAGGLVGSNIEGVRGVIANCYANGDVQGPDMLGGLVGNNYGSIVNCYATGTVVSDDDAGGLVGYNGGTIANSYSTGPVSGTDDIGGLVGGTSGVISNCFWDTETSGRSNMCGSCYSTGCDDCNDAHGKTTTQMRTEATFADAGWDFVGETDNGNEEIWRMCVDGVSYPLLWWQFSTGDFLCPDGVSFIDYSVLANHWRDIDCSTSNDCGRTDLDFSDMVDWDDLKIFCDHWLQGL